MEGRNSNSLDIHYFFFFFNDTATTEIYTLSLHDALPISSTRSSPRACTSPPTRRCSRRAPSTPSSTTAWTRPAASRSSRRSEEHTSELQSRQYLVCRLLLEKKKNKTMRSSTRSHLTSKIA